MKTVRAGALSLGCPSEQGEFQQDVAGQGRLCRGASSLTSSPLLDTHHPRCLPEPRPMILTSVSVVCGPCGWLAAQTAPARAGLPGAHRRPPTPLTRPLRAPCPPLPSGEVTGSLRAEGRPGAAQAAFGSALA